MANADVQIIFEIQPDSNKKKHSYSYLLLSVDKEKYSTVFFPRCACVGIFCLLEMKGQEAPM